MVARFSIVLLISILLAMACGPSFRRTHQSDNAFARCFDMDYNPAAKRRHKTKCWSNWLSDYVYNQPEDKIAYAEMRLDEIIEGVSIPGPPGKPGSFNKRPKPQKMEETKMPKQPAVKPKPKPEPVPDPAPAPETEASDTEPPTAPETTEPPSANCEQACKDTHTACMKTCDPDAGPASTCKSECVGAYTACMKKCF